MATKPISQCLQDEVNSVIDKYRDEGITISETVGVLEIIKMDLYNEQAEDAAEEF